MIKKILLLTTIFVFIVAVLSAGEYYQYTDTNGKLRFTDDISDVPKEQREALKKFKTIKSSEIKITNTDINTPESSTSLTKERDEPLGKIQASAIELDEIQKRINETRVALENERGELEIQTPKKEASKSEIIEYANKVEALNERIAQYEKELKVFNDKVNAFNNSRREQRGE